MGFPSFGPGIMFLLVLLPLWFFSRAVARAGFSPWWVLLGIVPLLNIVMLWVFAYAKWPKVPEQRSS